MRCNRRHSFFFAAIVVPIFCFGRMSPETHQAFLDLSNDFVLMDLSAHPDDEDGSTLAYYRMKYGVKTYSVLFTRGEGGQNEKGPELYEALGVLRSAETEAAGKILGTEVHFLNFKDFGFSKTATETFQKWGGQTEVLRRLVYVIRKYKPDILFTNHNTIDGHGNHQAVAITAIAAFDAAADPKMFPEQLGLPGITVWQPRKLFFRTFGNDAEPADVSNGIAEFDSTLGKDYIEIASEALRMHRTQGLDRANLRRFSRGRSRYRLMRSNSIYESDTTSFFSGIDLWSDASLRSLLPLNTMIRGITPEIDRRELLSRATSAMREIDSLRATAGLSTLAQRILESREKDLAQLVMRTWDVHGSFTFADTIVVPGQKVEGQLRLTSEEGTLGSVGVRIAVPDGWSEQPSPDAPAMSRAHEYHRDYIITVGKHPHFTLPREIAQYDSIELQDAVAAEVSLTLDGNSIHVELFPRFDVAPPEVLTVEPAVAGLTPARHNAGVEFTYTIRNYMPHKTAGRIVVEAPSGWRSEKSEYILGGEDSMATGEIHLLPPDGVPDGSYPVKFKSDYALSGSVVNAVNVLVEPGLRVGIVESYDNTLEDVLGDLGVQYHLLTEEDLKASDLSVYQSIIIDIRAYLVREDLKKWNDRLLDYARAGGNLIVTYQRDQEWRPEYAPYPFRITRRRVTVEEAPIDILIPNHPLMNHPNTITEKDWEGWKQERGLYFPGDVAPQYSQLLSCHDPDEPPLTTGYLVASVGHGSYIYTSYVWYRQLKDHNPGALRCFANMISYPAHRK